MTVWEDLVTTALVGTERRPFPAERLRGLVDAPAPAVEGAEAQVLAAAAVAAAYRRAGRLPERSRPGSLPVPSPPDDRPLCSDTAVQLLALLLGGMVTVAGGVEDLVEDWLAACARAGRRPPQSLLVPLLERATVQPRLREAVVAATGPRSRWLGEANPDWAWAAPAPVPAEAEDLHDRYSAAPRSERVALLEALRRSDRPAARALLLSTWATEPAAERSALLGTLAAHLDDDDEPLLEDALDDRAASVRAAAADLLDRLPRSRRAARMADRARALVRSEGRFRRRIVADLPDAIDDAARRDGITDVREAGTGLRMAWFFRIVASTPLDVWEPHLGLAAAEAIRLAAADVPELITAWTQAAAHQGDERWAEALLAYRPNPLLVGVLSPAAARRYAENILREPDSSDARFLDALAAPGPWATALSTLAVQRARRAPSAYLGMILPVFASRLDPLVLPSVEAWIESAPEDRARRDLRSLAHALTIRQSISREFS